MEAREVDTWRHERAWQPGIMEICWECVDDGVLGRLFEAAVLVGSFVGLGIICDDHMVVALETLCTRWNVPGLDGLQ